MNTLLRWLPRLFGFAVALFLSLFALDAFGDGQSVMRALPGFVIGLAPAAIVLAAVALAWRSEWIGAAAFTMLAAAYAIAAREHVSWIAAISGPLLAAALLYLWSWSYHRRHPLAP
jgi:hypothetical protein